MIARVAAALLTLVILAAPRGDAPPRVVVAPWGDDAGPGTADRPFATLDRARRAVRAYLAGHRLTADLVVTIRGGRYEVPATIVFDAADSGRDGHDVIYRAAPGEQPILDAGRTVTGWAPGRNGVWHARVPGAEFRQLYVDGRRAVRARRPDEGASFVLPAEREADGLDLEPGGLAGVIEPPDTVELSVLVEWMHKRLRLSGWRRSGRFTRAVVNPIEWRAVTTAPQANRIYKGRAYWLENARAFLDRPGEFFLDQGDGTLLYYPLPGQDLRRTEVTRPELETIITLDGTPAVPVHHLRFERLSFAHTGWTRPSRYGFVDVQANSLIPSPVTARRDPRYRHDQRKDRVAAALDVRGGSDVTIAGCRFVRLGGTGILIRQGGRRLRLTGNEFADLSGGGIEIGDDANRPDDPRLIPADMLVERNRLSRVGRDHLGSVAILAYYTRGLRIRRNLIEDSPYTAISLGWGWTSPGPPGVGRNRIERNHVLRYGRRARDGGGIYLTGAQPGTVVEDNLIEGMDPAVAGEIGGALYPDEATSGVLFRRNVVRGAQHWLYIWTDSVRGNMVRATYSDTARHVDRGSDNVVEPARLITSDKWRRAAERIAARARSAR